MSDKCDAIPMDSLIMSAARALAAGDPLGALNRVALRDDAPALALRGIAMARLGDLLRAKSLLRRAARAFGPKDALARARCVVAEAEIALVSRDLSWPAKALDSARATLEEKGDRMNAAHARHLEVRRLLLIGRVSEAEHALAQLDPAPFPPASRAAHELVVAGIAMRRLQAKAARASLARAERAARRAGIPALLAEVENASLALSTPAARLIAHGEERLLLLAEVEELLASKALVVDACRHVVRDACTVVSLARRPVLFELARALGEAWPGDVPRDMLVARAFGAKLADESHRARLRVEVGRLRTVLRTLAGVRATKAPRRAGEVAVLARPVEEQHAAVLALLSDGESWSSSTLALALGSSQRTVQRALEGLAAAGKAQSFGRGRARRWVTPPVPGSRRPCYSPLRCRATSGENLTFGTVVFRPSRVMKLRRADPSDLGAVQRISAEAYTSAYQTICGFVPKPAFEDYRPRIDRGEVWILEMDGQPIGVAVVEDRPDHLLVYSIAVSPHEQRKGHGAALLRFADEHAAAIGRPEVRLYTNQKMERNIALYSRHGFVEVGTRPHPSRPGDVLVDMVRTLRTDSSV